MSTKAKIETILFVASKPLSFKKIAKVVGCGSEEIGAAIEELKIKYNSLDSGVSLLQNNDEWQLVSNSENKEAAEVFLKAEVSGELTRPQLETLTVVAYCGPITKPVLEQIRGVNCSLILRNLMLRGLIKENANVINLLPEYEVTMDFLRHLGLDNISELADYAELHNHPHIEEAMARNESGV